MAQIKGNKIELMEYSPKKNNDIVNSHRIILSLRVMWKFY